MWAGKYNCLGLLAAAPPLHNPSLKLPRLVIMLRRESLLSNVLKLPRLLNDSVGLVAPDAILLAIAVGAVYVGMHSVISLSQLFSLPHLPTYLPRSQSNNPLTSFWCEQSITATRSSKAILVLSLPHHHHHPLTARLIIILIIKCHYQSTLGEIRGRRSS